MTKFVDLTATTSVNPEHVVSVFILDRGAQNLGPACVLVTMLDNVQHRIEPAYNESLYQTKDRLMKKLRGDNEPM